MSSSRRGKNFGVGCQLMVKGARNKMCGLVTGIYWKVLTCGAKKFFEKN
jgi:hypothetical protein